MSLEDSIDMAQRVRDIPTQARLRDLWCLMSSEWRGIRDVAVEDCNAALTRYGQVLKFVLDALSTASLDDLPNDLVRLYHIFLLDNKSYVMNIAHGSDQLESVCHDYDMLHHLFEDIIELRKSARCTASTSTGDCVLPNNSSGEEEDGDGEVEEVDMVMDAPDFDIDVEPFETVSGARGMMGELGSSVRRAKMGELRTREAKAKIGELWSSVTRAKMGELRSKERRPT